MSLSLTGFRFPAESLSTLLPKLRAVRAKAEPLACQLLVKTVLKLACQQLDLLGLGQTDLMQGFVPGRPLLLCAADRLQERQDAMVMTQRRDPAVDMDVDLVLIPFNGDLLGLLYCERPELAELVANLGQDFSYWDGADKPDSVSEAEWDVRKAAWESVLQPVDWVPGAAGVTYAVCSTRALLLPAPSDALLPTNLERVQAVADVLLPRYLEATNQNPSMSLIEMSAVLASPEFRLYLETVAHNLPPVSVSALYSPVPGLATEEATA